MAIVCPEAAPAEDFRHPFMNYRLLESRQFLAIQWAKLLQQAKLSEVREPQCFSVLVTIPCAAVTSLESQRPSQ